MTHFPRRHNKKLLIPCFSSDIRGSFFLYCIPLSYFRNFYEIIPPVMPPPVQRIHAVSILSPFPESERYSMIVMTRSRIKYKFPRRSPQKKRLVLTSFPITIPPTTVDNTYTATIAAETRCSFHSNLYNKTDNSSRLMPVTT